jgi:hypothetical protein
MWATYPMQYLQSFNYKPYEVVVRPSDNNCLVSSMLHGFQATCVHQLRNEARVQVITGAEWSISATLYHHVQDGAYEPNPTCGWYWAKGVKVPDSQGFTCECSTSLIWDTTFGGTNLRT